MTSLTIRFDLRCPPISSSTLPDLYQESLAMAEWADQRGFAAAVVTEHHGTEDGYLPSPLVMLSAIAARTKSIRLQSCILVLPFHDPLRVAEDMAVLDQISGGRAELVVAGGYVPSEFTMFGVDLKARGKLVEEGIETLKKAWTGEPFTYRGRPVRVTPCPIQRPHPPLYMGGSSRIAAERAARLVDGFIASPEWYKIFNDSCKNLGKKPVRFGPSAPPFLHISKNPDDAWEKIAPFALYEANTYARWQQESNLQHGTYKEMKDIAALRQSGLYAVVTPDECLKMAEALGRNGTLPFRPLMAGMDPTLGWESLELLERDVLPHLTLSDYAIRD